MPDSIALSDTNLKWWFLLGDENGLTIQGFPLPAAITSARNTIGRHERLTITFDAIVVNTCSTV
jgi:hypothetical protein